MNRRTFYKSIFALSIASQFSFRQSSSITLKPLKPGDNVGLVCPSGPISQLRLEAAKNNITQLGYTPVVGKYVLEKKGYLAGTDKNRLADLHGMYGNPNIKAIWCIRGGYGATRILSSLNFRLIRKNPKPLIGYSDITALHQAVYTQTGIPGMHGPNASSKFDEFVVQAFQNVLSANPFTFENHTSHMAETWNKGRASGVLIGGNLTVFTSLCGTPYAPDCRGKIVLLEDIGESPYRIDRMLTQLLDGANLSRASGIILGQFTDCETSDPDISLSLDECLRDRLQQLGIPILAGFSSGHVDEQVFLPIGCQVTMDAEKKEVRLASNMFSDV